MIVGQKVVCINDRFPAGIGEFYIALPVKGVTYTIRDVSVGVNWCGEAGEVCVHLKEIVNPKSNVAPYPERGFNAERFAPMEEETQEMEAVETGELVNK